MTNGPSRHAETVHSEDMDFVGDYFQWIFSLGFAGVAVMFIVTGVAAAFAVLAVGNAIIWTMVGVKRLFGGDVSRSD